MNIDQNIQDIAGNLKIVYRGLLLQLHHTVPNSWSIRLNLQMELSLLLGSICALTGEDPQEVQDDAESNATCFHHNIAP